MHHSGYYTSSEAEAVAVLLVVIFTAFVILMVVAIKALVACKIFAKAGYCWALGLLMLVPVANIIMPFVLAFGDWPVRQELRRLKDRVQEPQL
ncbi:MAG: hypothetical protein JSU70_14865 [Phycisphaerales bacterium]|nr:MAG: hypothetical protein JSU70_14865 [Phycisphaerales bacterium]